MFRATPKEDTKLERTIRDQLANHYLIWKLKFLVQF